MRKPSSGWQGRLGPRFRPFFPDSVRAIAANVRKVCQPRSTAWVSRFSRLPRLKHGVAEGLCRRGVLPEDVGKILLISRKIDPERDGQAEMDIIARLRSAVSPGPGSPSLAQRWCPSRSDHRGHYTVYRVTE